MFIVLLISTSAAVAGYTSIQRLLHPEPISHLWAVAVAAIIGFVGNEAVALFRINVGKEIGSAALIADGYHARVDGLTSLAVLELAEPGSNLLRNGRIPRCSHLELKACP